MNESVVKLPKKFKELDSPYRYKVMYGGRGSAKSWTVARKLLLRCVENPLLILCTRELQKSIKQSVHRLLRDQIKALQLENFFTITETSIKGINGSEFIFLGVKHNTEEIKSTEGVDICWIEEGHSLTENSWDIIDPTIRAEGSEIWITYNTRFKFDYIHKMFVIDKPPGSSLVIKVNHDDNPYFTDVLKKQMNEMKEKDIEKYLHIWEGELKKLAEGAIFGKQIAEVDKTPKRRLYIPIQKTAEVKTYSDVGKHDPTAFWFMQKVGKEYQFIDYFQGRLEEVAYYVRAIKKLDYNYGSHYMPHDAFHERLGMERNIAQQFEDGGVKPVVKVDRIKEKNLAIQLARDVFPNCWFHLADDKHKPVKECEGYLDVEDEDMQTRARRMDKGFEALCNYRYKYRDEDDAYQLNPHHDWASNGADAFMGFAQSHNVETITGWDRPLNVHTEII